MKDVEFSIKEYTPEEYKQDMLKLIRERGLKGAVKEYLDKIVEETSGMSYIPSMSVKEWAYDILNICNLWEEKKK